MSALARKIEQQASKLSPAERERIAVCLLEGIRGRTLTDVDEAWIKEAERRYRRWKRGLVRAIPSSRVIREIRKELSE